jgi:lipopolysaccharide transport system ATP-binding protein
VGIIGRNGAGKSTLLKVLSKITEPTEGRVELRGRVGSLLEVGTGFHPELTGHENVYLYGAILGMDRWEVTRKFDEIISFAELEKFVDTPVKRYSSGMYMRLAFAVAAHLEPEILLVDEVLAVGDAAFQKKCLGKMGDVSKEGRTVLFVSHNMGAIQKLCSRSLLLERGQIAIDNNTQQVVEAYLASREEGKFGMDALQDLPRRAGLGELIRITKCLILNSKNEPTDLILFGEPFTVCIEAMANSELRDLSVIVGIDSFTEYRITTFASEDNDMFFSASATHPLRVQARLDTLALKPGIYLITLGIRSRGTGLDHLPHILRLEVTEASEKGGRYDSGTWGVVHAVAAWKDMENTGDLAHHFK